MIEATRQPKPEPAAAESPAQAPAPVRAAEVAGESWLLLSPDTLAHVSVYPPIGRKLTEIFNFATAERTVISENLKTGAETTTSPEKFETLGEDILQRAGERLKALGGAIPDKTQKKAFNL
jgi:hypothetical protein